MDGIAVAEFRVARPADASAMPRRAKMFAALSGLPAQQRNALARAVTAYCRDAVQQNLEANVRFALSRIEQNDWIECSISLPGGPDSEPIAVANQGETIEAVDGVDWFESQNWPHSGGSVVLRQAADPAFVRPGKPERDLWRRILSQRSMEDALLMIRQQGHLAESCDHRGMLVSDEFGTEDSHAETRSILSLVARGTDNFVAILDGDGGIIWINDAFTRMTGYQQNEVEYKRLDELLTGPESSATLLNDLGDAIRHGYAWSEEIQLQGRDGHLFWAHFTTTPVQDEKGARTRWIVIGTDVTRQRSIVQQLAEAKESAEEASRLKSEFLANMSHEIRTPLNAVIGMTDLCLGTELSRAQRDYLTTVKLSAESLLDLLNDVLDLSKIESGRLAIDLTEFNLGKLIRDVFRALAVRAHVKGLELLVHMPLDVPQWVSGDPVRLRQVLVNLVGNAIKFTNHGEVALEVQPQWSSNGEVSLHFTVSDTGVGIPKEKLEQIFEAFEQADASITREFGGSGLGLAISSKLLELMGGRIWVNSELGQGSRFHFSLRFPIVEQTPIASPGEFADRLQGLRVLAVDDHSTNRQILEELLESWHMKPTLASSGPEALEILEASRANGDSFDLVLLDGMMPGMDGFEVAERITSEFSVGTIMMLSSVDRPESSARCQQLGIQRYLTKPISPSTLLEQILAALGLIETCREEMQVTRTVDRFQQLQPSRRKLRVLVADDHDPNRVVALRILQERGHECEAAVNGDEAVRMARQTRYDAILMDIQMPVCDGYQATAQLRQLDEENKTHTPIIALTAHAMLGDREKCLAAGMDGYLPKPLDALELIRTVEHLTQEPAESLTHHAQSDPPNSLAPSQRNGHHSKAALGQMDFSRALQRMAGDLDLLRGQMESFLEDAPRLVDELATALRAGRRDELIRAAHRLRSLLAAFDRDSAAESAQYVETTAEAGGSLQPLCGHENGLRAEVETVSNGIHQFLEQHVGSQQAPHG